MSSRFVRPSKFRHVYAEPYKVEQCYSDLDLSPVTGDHSYIKGNSKFFVVAVRGGGGPVLVLPYSQVGKLPRGYPTLNGHSASVYDTAWNPFNDNILATASDDTTVKLWHIPDNGLTENIRDSMVTLSGHGKPVSLLTWNPTANNVLASVGKDPSVKIWDVEKGADKGTISGFGGLVQDLTFNYNGSLLATSDKAKQAKIHDVRANAVANEWSPHEGGKAFKILFLGESGQILTVGFTKQSKREFKLWDGHNFSEPMTTFEVDQAAGVMLPFYDEDTRMLFLTGKGDGNIRYFEFVDESPFVYLLSEHRTNVSTKGADMLPKRACNPLKCEVGRMLKLTGDSVEPLSFIVPRKSEAFQEDIFPDTFAGKASVTADEYFAGKTAAPKKMSMDPAKGGAISASSGSAQAYKPIIQPAATPAPSHVSSPQAASGPAATPVPSVSTAELEHAVSRAKVAEEAVQGHSAHAAQLEAKIAELEQQLAKAHERISDLEASESRLKKALQVMAAQ